MRQRTLKETNWAVFLLLALALALIANYLSYRHYHRWDVTAGGSYSLSPQTVKVLRDLKGPLKVVVFLAPTDELYPKVKDLLSAYQAASPEVKVEVIDPDRDRARVQELAKKYNVSVANVVVFDAGEHSKYVERDQMVDLDFSSMQMGMAPKVKAFKAEEAFTNAILDAVNPKAPVVYFTQGHGERGQEGQEGVGILRDRLTKEGAQVRDWQSLGKDSVPPDADLLIVAGPQQPFLPQEGQVIGRYLQGGGKALFLLDPVLKPGKPPALLPTGLEDTLTAWGLKLDQDIVIDPQAAAAYLGSQTFFASSYSEHPIVRDLSKNNLPVLFSLAQSVHVDKPDDGAYQGTALMRTSEASWGLRDLSNLEKVQRGPGDVGGPLVLAAAVSSDQKAKKTRIVASGSAEILSDAELQRGGGNLMFGLNAVHWLLSQESRLAIPPKTSQETHLALSSSQANFLFILFVAVMPGAVVAAGVWVYLKRRR